MLGSTSAHWSSYDPVVDVISGVTDGTLHWQYLGLTWFSFPSTEESLSFWDFFILLRLTAAFYKLVILGKNPRNS